MLGAFGRPGKFKGRCGVQELPVLARRFHSPFLRATLPMRNTAALFRHGPVEGAMLVSRAGVARIERYNRWYALLLEEINLCATPDARIVAVGNVVSQHLLRRAFRRPFTRVIHYSSQAGPARRAGIVGQEASFQAFNGSVTLEDLVASAAATLETAGVPSEFRDEALARLAKVI